MNYREKKKPNGYLTVEDSSRLDNSIYTSSFRKRPKDPNKTDIGAKLEKLVSSCLKGIGFRSEIVHKYHQPVDFIYGSKGFGFECKNLVGTRYVTISWIKKEVLYRFDEQEKELGIPIPKRGLVVTEKKWSKEIDCLLEVNNIRVCVVGRIDSKEHISRAKQIFIYWIEDMLWDISKKEVKRGE
ncbi:MAG: hypothetical protein AC479_06270 [miscellaneous Crenarchaeota group-6 archaeon AD8-1]|nr:MAG: hypothetical protein AC479_06270 [miscellaneous Crenarchaeota group-6 archaeon AD8-1]